LTRIKAHATNYGNELADNLAKENAINDGTSFNRSPKSEIAQQEREQSIAKWQIQWDRTTKGLTTKQFFRIIKGRLITKIKLTPNFTAIVTTGGCCAKKKHTYIHKYTLTHTHTHKEIARFVYD